MSYKTKCVWPVVLRVTLWGWHAEEESLLGKHGKLKCESPGLTEEVSFGHMYLQSQHCGGQSRDPWDLLALHLARFMRTPCLKRLKQRVAEQDTPGQTVLWPTYMPVLPVPHKIYIFLIILSLKLKT